MEKYLARIKTLYEKMDRAYRDASGGFSCEGCSDNCCSQTFYHHTISEYIYLMDGLSRADEVLIERIMIRARVVVGTYMKGLDIGEILPVMCPINENGKCTLYEWRPMICRLHGIAYSFTKPNGEVVSGGGCHRFKKEGSPLDRTPFYRELAEIEKSLREEIGFRGRYAKTTAQMLLDMTLEGESWHL